MRDIVLATGMTGGNPAFLEQLVRLFHRRNLRNHLLLGPEGSKMVAHFPTQPFADARGVGIG